MKYWSFAVGLSLLSLIACGGGGGGDPEPPAPPLNVAPNANAAADFSTVANQPTSLDGSASSDPDGSIASYQWRQTMGAPDLPLTNATSAIASFIAPDVSVSTSFTFELTVTDDDGASDTDSVVVTVVPDERPVAVAPADFQAVQNSQVNLDGSSSSDDLGIISYNWQQTGGDPVVLTGSDTVSASFTAPDFDPAASTVLTFELTVTDAAGQSSSDSVAVTIIEVATTQRLSGTVTYEHVKHNSVTNGLDHTLTTEDPVRGATIELLNNASSAIVATSKTDENGNYEFTVDSGETYRVRVKAELLASGSPSWDFTVVDNTSSDALYAVDSSAVTVQSSAVVLDINMDSGWTGSGYGNLRLAGPFAILDSVYESVIKIINVDPDANFPDLKLHWSPNNINTSGVDEDPCVNYDLGEIGTSFYTTRSGCAGVYILGDANSDTDEYDGHVVVHEWGHYFENVFSRSDSIGGSHSLSAKLDLRVALGEGFGNALSGMVTDDPFYRDSFGSSQSNGFSINVESNPGISGNRGWYSEGSVQSVLYDMYDENNDGSDNFSIGFAPIYNALVGAQQSTEALTSIFSLVGFIKQQVPASASDIDNLLASQQINSSDEFADGETNDDGNSNTLPVYKVITDDGVSVEVCSDGDNGQYNRLGNRQFLVLNVATTKNFTILVETQSASDDPDLVIHKAGQIVAISDEVGGEALTTTLSAGRYVLEVYEYANVDSDETPKLACSDVTITSI